MKVAILGASRGLGKSLTETSPAKARLWLASRKISGVQLQSPGTIEKKVVADFSHDESQRRESQCLWLKELQEFEPQTLIYCAGGGPFGEFDDIKWPSHHWALQVTLLTPLWLVHWATRQNNLKQVIVIGSAIAESDPDPKGSSYAAAKHGLRGFHSSFVKENSHFDFRLFSPGYMDTDLLPAGCPPRQQSQPIWSPNAVAQKIWSWASDATNFQAHKAQEPFAPV